MTEPVEKRRRRFVTRLTLRAAILLIALAACLFAWAANKARAQRRALEVVRQFKGGVAFDYEFENGKKVWDAEPWAPAWLRAIFGEDYFRDVVEISFIGHDNDKPIGDGLAVFQRLPHLRRLELSDGVVRGQELRHLRGMRRLEVLNLSENNFTGDELAALAELPRLRELDLSANDFRGDHLRRLKPLVHLEKLNLSAAKLGPQTLQPLESFTNLRTLDLSETMVDAGGLRDVGLLVGPRELNLNRNDVTDDGLANLEPLKNLQRLLLYRNNRITDAGLKRLRGLTGLQELFLEGIEVSDRGLETLTSLRDLRALSLAGPRLTDAAFASLRKFERLQSLSIDRILVMAEDNLDGVHNARITPTSVSDCGLAKLEGWQSLRELTISGPGVTDAGMAHIAKLPNLERLVIGGHITEAGLAQFAKMPRLKYVQFRSALISPQAFVRATQAIPGLRGSLERSPF